MSWRKGPNPLIEQQKIQQQLRQQRRLERLNQKRFLKDEDFPIQFELFPEEKTLNDIPKIIEYFETKERLYIHQSLSRLKLLSRNLDFIEPIIQSQLPQYLIQFASSNEVLLRANSFSILAHLCASNNNQLIDKLIQLIM